MLNASFGTNYVRGRSTVSNLSARSLLDPTWRISFAEQNASSSKLMAVTISRARAIWRDKWLTEHRYKIMRFWNNDVLTNIDGVLETVALALKKGAEEA
jgi:hypothetical protein